MGGLERAEPPRTPSPSQRAPQPVQPGLSLRSDGGTETRGGGGGQSAPRIGDNKQTCFASIN